MTLHALHFQMVTITTPTEIVASKDEYNTTTFETDVFEANVSMAMQSSTEDENDRNTITNAFLMLVDPDVNINEHSTVTWTDASEGEHLARVMGQPIHAMMRRQLHHLEVTLQEVMH